MQQQNLTLTATAAEYIANNLKSNPEALGLRVGVKPSGCSGMSYILDLATATSNDDKVFESNNIKVFVDKESLKYVQGSTLDYVTDGLNQQFKIINPNAVADCGCGESFSVDHDPEAE